MGPAITRGGPSWRRRWRRRRRAAAAAGIARARQGGHESVRNVGLVGACLGVRGRDGKVVARGQPPVRPEDRGGRGRREGRGGVAGAPAADAGGADDRARRWRGWWRRRRQEEAVRAVGALRQVYENIFGEGACVRGRGWKSVLLWCLGGGFVHHVDCCRRSSS